MPKRTDIHTILIPGSGPIVIGQAAEFDYSGTQAIKALRERGLPRRPGQLQPGHHHDRPRAGRRDLHRADHARGRWRPSSPRSGPTRMLPTVGGQTGLNLALALSENGVLARYGVTLLGASLEAIQAAEDRRRFRKTSCWRPGCRCRPAGRPSRWPRPRRWPRQTGYPLLVRASFALGGSGASVGLPAGRAGRGRAQGHRRVAHRPGLDRAVDHGLEGVRAGGDARPGRQLRGGVQHREPGPHGRAHRRQHHRGPGADADRPRVPGAARPGAPGDAGRGGADRRRQRAVRRRSRAPARP